jgi:hypothetical protein
MKVILFIAIVLGVVCNARAEDPKLPIKEPPKTGETRPPSQPPKQSESDKQKKPVDENYTPKAPQAR